MLSSTQLRMALAAAILVASLPQRTEALHFTSPGTTNDMNEIFIGRCWGYQRLVNPEPFKDALKNCTALWTLFVDAFANKPECGVNITDFDGFVEGAYHTIPGKVLFHSKVRKLIDNGFANRGRRFFNIESTLGGYILDGLGFCGQEDAPGLNYDSCPNWWECDGGNTKNAFGAVWSVLSKQFAATAEGEVFGVYNGSLGQAYDNNSIFARVEVPNLNATKVTKFTVMVLYDIGRAKNENCTEGSIDTLQKDIKKKNISVECIDDPPMVKHFLCVDEAKSVTECQFQTEQFDTSGCARRHVSYAGSALAALAALTLAINGAK